MKLKKILFSTFVFFLLTPLSVMAASDDSYDKKKTEVQQLVDSGVAYLQSHDIEQAKVAFSDPKGSFAKDELYLFVIDFSNKILVHGKEPTLISENFTQERYSIPGSERQRVGKEMTNLAKTTGFGWVEYKWMNYSTNKVMDKESYVKRVPGKDYYVGSGFYKED